MKQIYVPYGYQRKLQREIKVSKNLISYALRFERNSLISRRIRSEALNYFKGIEI